MSTKSKKTPQIFPGTLADVIFFLKDSSVYSWAIEPIDKNLFELTICTYDEEVKNRTEYVLHCNRGALIDLKKMINQFV